eukprot:UN23481
MAGATKFEEDNLCYLWKTDCTLMVPPRQMRFLDIDPPLNGWSLDLADAKNLQMSNYLKTSTRSLAPPFKEHVRTSG